MKFGCCVDGFDQVGALEAAGADYCELPVAGGVMANGEDGRARFFEEIARCRVKPLGYYILFPRTLPLVGSSADEAAIRRYSVEAVDRMSAAGGRTVVFGSGRARSIPDGVRREDALDQLERLLRWIVAEAGGRGLVIALEPLCRAESNVFNSIGECAAFVRDRRLDGVRLVADSYHMVEESEPLEAIDAAADLVAHAHVADDARRPPGQGHYDLAAFLRRLRLSGYRGNCSIECNWTDFANEIGPSMGAVRRAAAEAGWGGGTDA